jgi:cullin 3
LGVELEVKVLTQAHWPSSLLPPCRLPAEVLPPHGAFAAFYLGKHTGRKLAWQTNLGSAVLKARFSPTSRHELDVTTFQMCLLMAFNGEGNETQSLEALEELGIPAGELRRHLVSLCTPKHRILLKASKGKAIDDKDSFTVNADYSSKLKRVKVPLVSAKDTASASLDAVPEAVDEDRRHLVEASIVRIMKARRTLQHNELIAEVTRQLANRFSPVPAFIKKRVESLIEREYLERSADDRRMYTYLA